MAKVPRCNGCWWAIEKRMTVNKTTNTRKGVSVRVTTGGQLIKGNTKLKWTTFSASLPHTRFSKHQFQDKQLSLFLLSNRWYTGRERGSKRVFYLLVSSTAERFLWDPQHVQMVFELHLFRSPSLLLLLEQPADHKKTDWEQCLSARWLFSASSS